MIYELDITTRQLRLMKDNVFTLEKKLSDTIYLTYQKELDNTRLTLGETRKKFGDFSSSVNAKLMADVRDNCNTIDQLMKNKAELFKNLQRSTQTGQYISNTTINIKNLTVQAPTGGEGEGEGKEEKMKEYERLVRKEREAREEIIKLHEYVRKQRMMARMKEVLLKQKYEFKIDNLKQQLTSNVCLWE